MSPMRARRGGRRLSGLAAVATMLVLGCSAAASAAPSWRIVSLSNTTVAPGGTLEYRIDLTNVGDVATDGTPYTVTATLPAGMTAVSAEGSGFECPGAAGATVVTCTDSDLAIPFSNLALSVVASVDPNASGTLTATFDVAGGGAAPGSTVDPVRVSATPPGFGVDAFDTLASDASGQPMTQAGAHPDVFTTSFDLNTVTDPSPMIGPRRTPEALKDVVVDLPPGFVGNPTSLDQCTGRQLAETVNGIDPQPLCPATSQVGTALVRHSGQGVNGAVIGPVPVFNMVPPTDVPARLGFNFLGTVVVLDARVRSGGDYGLTVSASNTPEAIALIGTTLNLWGVPSDPSHDAERACPGQFNPWAGGPSCPSGAPRRAFFRNPTSCPPPGVGVPTTLRVDSWQHPGNFQAATSLSHLLPGYPHAPVDWGPQHGPDGCASVPFEPSFRSQPLTGARAGEPAAMAFDIEVPQTDDPASVGQSDLRRVTVTLPQGVHVSPASADGLQGCSSAQIALHDAGEPSCPDASKLGSVTIDTPLLSEPVTGSIFLATPFDNPFRSLIAIYLVASARGVVIKLPGQVTLDAGTGQVATTFDDTPQLPFSRLHVEFDAGPRTALTMPDRCGSYTTRADFEGWSGATVSKNSTFTLSDGAGGASCPSTFAPGFSAGMVSNVGGASSSFLLRLTRDDADQKLGSVAVNLPRGLTGRLADVPLCGAAAAGAGTCTGASQVGNVTVGAGAGTDPFFITDGRAYLTGAYKGAPFGLSIVVPAVAGPFDLGNVNVRAAIFVDRHTSAITVVSDPLPHILQGIPLEVRDVRVTLDRRGFMLNPTSCAGKRIFATVGAFEGAVAHVSDRFQAADCAHLGFAPRMTLRVGGRGHTHLGQPTPFSTRLTMPKGDANLRYVRVTLPRTLTSRLNVINDACTRAQFETDIATCAHARAGTASAVTPLLRDPLRGNVYFVKNGHALPDLFVALRGQVAFDLIGRITIVNSTRLRTTFNAAPDVPIRSFALRLFGDRANGSVAAATNLCTAAARRQKVELDYIGQNGKVRQTAQALAVGGCRRR